MPNRNLRISLPLCQTDIGNPNISIEINDVRFSETVLHLVAGCRQKDRASLSGAFLCLIRIDAM
jgi:hypothetical protein